MARRLGHRQGRKIWRGRDVTPSHTSANNPYGQRWGRLPPRKRNLGVLSVLITFSIGAVLAVLIALPLLPEEAKMKILQVQQKVAELAPWLQGE